MRTMVVMFVILISATFLAGYLGGTTTSNDDETPLVIGVFPRFHHSVTMESFKPLTAYLAKKLNRRVRLVTSESFTTFWERMRNREFDIVHYNQYHYIRTHKELDYEVFAMNEERGKRTISAAIAVHKKSNINNIQDLKGKTILFGGSQQAMISYIYATYLLREEGLKSGDYQVRFEKNPPKALVATYHGLWDAQAAGVGDVVLGLPLIKKMINSNEMKILKVGKPYAHLPWAFKSELQPNLKSRIKKAFLALNGDNAGKKILKKAKLSGIAEAKDTDFDPHRAITLKILGENYY